MSFSSEEFEQGEKVGSGRFGVVFKCRRLSDDKVFAVKQLQRGGTSLREVRMMERLRGHDHIATLEGHYETATQLFIVVEWINGGELFEQIVKLKHYAETDARAVTANLLSALQFMHSRGIAHRDLKEQNVLLSDPNDLTRVKIVDFGFAEVSPPAYTVCCGTPYYMAPEILNHGIFDSGEPYGVACDLWSLGVLVYILLCGYPPFRGASTNGVFKATVRGVYSFPAAKVWGGISDAAKDFLSQLLVLDPVDRLTAADAALHPWVARPDETAAAFLQETVSNLVEFNSAQKWRKGIFGVDAIARMQYAAACRGLALRPNSQLQDIFERSSTTLSRVDLSHNYVGPKGLMALLLVVQERPEIRELILGNNGVNNAVMERLCRIIRTHPGIEYIDLSSNPISHIAGRYLLTALQANQNITAVELGNTGILATTLKRIEAQLARNAAYCKRKATSPP